jgi:hypothetical protein
VRCWANLRRHSSLLGSQRRSTSLARRPDLPGALASPAAAARKAAYAGRRWLFPASSGS